MNLDQCLACGAAAVEERVAPFVVEHDGKTTTIQDRHMVCAACENISYRGAQASEHERAVAAALRQMQGLLSPEELSRIRAKYRLKQTDMESMLSTGPKTWTRWERGKITQSRATDKLIRAIADDPDLARRLMVDAGVVNPEAEAVFAQIERDEKILARTLLMAELREQLGAQAAQITDVVADKVFETARNARRQVASHAEAA